MLKKVLKYIPGILGALLIGEILLRLLGFSPYEYNSFYCESEPKHYLVTDSVFGINTTPGVFAIDLNGLKHRVSHTSNNLRSTFPILESNRKMSVYGCSFTYGTGVEDSSTVCSQLQQRTKDVQVLNFGKPAWGNTQMYLQMKQMFNQGIKMDKVVVNFCDFHLQRNGLSASYRLTLGKGVSKLSTLHQSLNDSIPYFNSNFQLKHEAWSDVYHEIPGRSSLATVNLIQTSKEAIEENKTNEFQLGIRIFEEMQKLCATNSTPLVVFGITASKTTKEFINELSSKGFDAHYAAIPFDQEGYNLSPFDQHPNRNAYRLLADRMINKLKKPKEY